MGGAVTRAVRNSRGQWCYPLLERLDDKAPVHRLRTLIPLQIPRKLTQQQADEACERYERRMRERI